MLIALITIKYWQELSPSNYIKEAKVPNLHVSGVWDQDASNRPSIFKRPQNNGTSAKNAVPADRPQPAKVYS